MTTGPITRGVTRAMTRPIVGMGGAGSEPPVIALLYEDDGVTTLTEDDGVTALTE